LGRPSVPIETYLRVIPEPVLRLTSIDLSDTKDVTTLEELFTLLIGLRQPAIAGVYVQGRAVVAPEPD